MSTAEISTLTKQYQDLHHDVNALRQAINSIQKSNHRIEQGLFGDEDISHAGALKELKDLRCLYGEIAAKIETIRINKINEDSLLKNNKAWLFGIASAIGGCIVWVFNYLTKHL